MRDFLILSLLLCLLDKAVCETLISVNASWNGELQLKCSHDQSLIFVKEALFGSLGSEGQPACTIHVGDHVRNVCNRKNSCKLSVILGPFLNPKLTNCTTTPGLYVKHVCINKGASIMGLSQIASKFAGYVKPTDKYKGGYESGQVQWKVINELCKSFPRSVQFELIDIDLAGDCNEEHLLIEVLEGKAKKKMGPFCQKDLDEVPPSKRVAIFTNITQVTFVFTTRNRNPGNRGFLLKVLAMQCKPLPVIANAQPEFWMTTDQEEVRAHVRCRDNFFPMIGSPSEVTVTCSGNRCLYDCPDRMDCSFGWKAEGSSQRLESLQCVPPSALTTTVTTTAASTVTSTASSTAEASTSLASHISPTTTPTKFNGTSPGAALLPTKPSGRRKTNNRQVIAGIIGGVVGIVACLIVCILGLMVCRKARCPTCCFDTLLYDKASYAGSQAPSHDTSKTFGDSTLALRYRPPSTISTHFASATLTSVPRSSVGSSILFPSNRRSKRKTLPHPSTLGYGCYDDSAPLFPEAPPVFSPSVETYLEPDFRASAPPPLVTFEPKSPPRSVYQVYDEARSSRNALDRFEPPRHDRHSMAMISNHYYCRGEGSDDGSVYEVVEEGVYSAGSTPCETRRNVPAAASNDYVQPPQLPARPATMRRSHQDLPEAPLAADDEDEDGYQPVNCANRPSQ